MPLVADLVANMLHTRPGAGSSLSYVMQHPAWWTAEEFKHFSAEAFTFLGKVSWVLNSLTVIHYTVHSSD